MSPTTLHTWSAVGSIATALAVIGGFLAVLFRGGRWITRATAGLVSATKANTTAIGELTSRLSATSGDVTRLTADVGNLTTQTALNVEHIKHNTTRIVRLEKGIRS